MFPVFIAPAGGNVGSYFTAWRFRFRGKTARLSAIVERFQETPNKGLGAATIARACGLSTVDVARLLNATPELFVKLPGRGDGITRYRLASSVAARGEDGAAELIRRGARRETILYAALVTLALLLAAVVVMAVLPGVL